MEGPQTLEGMEVVQKITKQMLTYEERNRRRTPEGAGIDGSKPECARYREAERGFLIGSSRGEN